MSQIHILTVLTPSKGRLVSLDRRIFRPQNDPEPAGSEEEKLFLPGMKRSFFVETQGNELSDFMFK
jgi:hypothetical protein